MTITTEKPEIVKCMIHPISVLVIDFNGNDLSFPFCQPTSFATMILQSGLDKPFPQLGSRIVGIADEDLD